MRGAAVLLAKLLVQTKTGHHFTALLIEHPLRGYFLKKYRLPSVYKYNVFVLIKTRLREEPFFSFFY